VLPTSRTGTTNIKGNGKTNALTVFLNHGIEDVSYMSYLSAIICAPMS
jgi:hypothetical protein